MERGGELLRQVAADKRRALPLIALLLALALAASACGGVQEAPGDAFSQEAPEGNPGSATGQGEEAAPPGVVESGDGFGANPAPAESSFDNAN